MEKIMAITHVFQQESNKFKAFQICQNMPYPCLNELGHVCTNPWASKQAKASSQMPKPISNYFVPFILYLFGIN